MEFGARFKTLREQSGFTQKNIADFLKVDQNFISEVENGECSLTSNMISNVSALFGIPVSSFFNDNDCALKTELALKTDDLTFEDLQAISVVNKIALNANFMTKSLGD